MATLDHIGLNRYIYMSASVDEMTLGSFDITEIDNEHSQSILGTNLDDSRLLLGVNLYNNGPYGYSSWQQMRMSQNPLSRHLRKNNQYSIVAPGKQRIYFKDGKRFVVEDRHGSQFLLDEPAVVSNYKPISLVGKLMDYNNVGSNFSINLTKRVSMNNNVAYFTNDRINNIAGLIEKPDEVYDILKGYYLEDALNSADSPMSSFEKLIFNQTIYPPQQYTYKSYTRARTTFSFNWNSDIKKRQQTNATSNFSFTNSDSSPSDRNVPSSSVWPLDVDPNWINRGLPLSNHVGVQTGSVVNGTSNLDTSDSIERFMNTSSFGILWNHYSQLADSKALIGTAKNHHKSGLELGYIQDKNLFGVAPLYSRRHTIANKESVVSPSGQTDLIPSENFFAGNLFGGEAFWDVPNQSGKFPFYNQYSDFSTVTKTRGKDCTIIPEFKMSTHIASLLSSNALNPSDKMFEINGSKLDRLDSSEKDFYKTYSTSDFLKNFDIILDDHKDFTNPSRITLKCKAIKKLIPYNGFYPVQRTVELAEQFYSSYSKFVASTTTYTTFLTASITVENSTAIQNLITPLFAPGVLFNTIKSGIAVDFPIITETLTYSSHITLDEDGNGVTQRFINNDFNKRIPFESLLEPEKFLSNYSLVCNEPHASGNLASSAIWDGNGDNLYSKMANNFLAEIPNFFLKDEKITTLASSAQSNPNFGQVTGEYSEYTMRVKMFRSMDSPNSSVTSSAYSNSIRYVPPQDISNSGRKETITMYSRPTAFGPPTYGKTTGGVSEYPDSTLINSSNQYVGGSNLGLNYPFTPPYYHGQSWADIKFVPKERKKYTVSEIIASSSVVYHRFDTGSWGGNITNNSTGGPQQLTKINKQAMHLDASLNLFSKGNLGEQSSGVQQNLANLNIEIDSESGSRWIIQPKFETPILNFADYVTGSGHTSNITLPNNSSSACVPIGMWHQYGRIPTETEGIQMQITDIPINWVEGALDQPNYEKTGSLADLCGFSQNPVKLGQINERKKISECVVAVPFVENSGVKEFFNIRKNYIDEAINGDDKADENLVDLVDKMNRFIFPPTFDFVNFPEKVDPIAMYVFEFSSYLSQNDLSDIWQNVLPDVGREHQEAESSITHSLIGGRNLINKRKLREDVRWMVFKVKQRAASRYYDQVFKKKGSKLTDLITEVTTDAAGPRSKIQYNWPYDFFSLVELVKIDASIEFSDVETDDNGEEQTVPKVAKEENARIQLDTLFPKGKK